MSSKEEQVKQQLQAAREKEESLRNDMERLRLEEEKRTALLSDESLSEKTEEKEAESHFKLKPSAAVNEDWKEILADYAEKYPDNPVKNNTLSFPTKEDAMTFFENQAKSTPPRKFFCSEVGQDGKLTGENVIHYSLRKETIGSNFAARRAG